MNDPHAIIRLLADGQIHSGQRLAERLGVTRGGVWKALRRIGRDFALTIESIKGQGYRLVEPLELLDADAILAGIPNADQRLGALHRFASIDSTSAWLTRQAAAGAASKTCCLAEHQHAGRGRQGRPWISPYGGNLYLSILWRHPAGPAELSGLSLAAGASVAAVLSAAGARELILKWPNDLHWRGRKLAGLLLEVAGESQGPSQAILGLGVNLRMPRGAGQAIDQPWVDLSEAMAEQPYSRNALAAALIDGLLDTFERFSRAGLPPFLETWRRFDGYRDQRVCVHWGQQPIPGRYRGIDARGGLLLEQDDGHLLTLHAGELSLRLDPDGQRA